MESEDESTAMPKLHMDSCLRILHAKVPAERDAWLAAWDKMSDRKPHYHPDYAELFASDSEKAQAAVYTHASGAQVLYPFLLRQIAGLSESQQLGLGELYDIVSPYGYGGPYYMGLAEHREVAERSFWTEFQAAACARNIVCEFIRFDLLDSSTSWYPGDRLFNQRNVVVDLTKDEADQWMHYRHKVRKNVQRAQRRGVQVVVDTKATFLDDFIQVYYATLERRHASCWYFFDRRFFTQLQAALPARFLYLHAVYQGEIISTELVLFSDATMYSFLGGSLWEHRDMRPNDLLKHVAINYRRAKGFKRYILGGGNHDGDGIYRYKLSFDPDGSVPFCVGHQIFLPGAYERLVQLRTKSEADRGQEWKPHPGFCPDYRSP